MRPANYKYSDTHEWVFVSGDTATVGITDYAVEHLSDLVFLELPRKGAAAAKGRPFGEIESVKAVSELFSPVTGEIIEVNESLTDNLDTLATDPFGKGWLLKVKLRDKAEPATMKSAAEYEKLLAAEAD
jgi:glycine cleavage system H protein